MQETQVRSLGWEDPRTRKWQLTSVFLPGESHGQRSLTGCSPWGSQSQTWLSYLHFHFSLHSHPTSRVSHLTTHCSSVGNCISLPIAKPFPSETTEWPLWLREGLKGHPTHCCHQLARQVHPLPSLDLWMCSFPFTHNQEGSGAKHILLGFLKHINTERHPKTYIWSKVFYAFYVWWQKARRN